MADINNAPNNKLLIAKKELEIKKQLLVLEEYDFKILQALEEIEKMKHHKTVSETYIEKIKGELEEITNGRL